MSRRRRPRGVPNAPRWATLGAVFVVRAAAFAPMPLLAQAHPAEGARTPADVRLPEATWRQALRWRPVGPVRGGRVTAVTGVRQEPFTFFFGSTGGGVWKTTNAGTTWRNVSDSSFACASMGALAVAPSDPAVVYAGTGSDGIRSNVSAGCGMYVSRDGGETWSFGGLRDAGQVGAIVVHPTQPDVAWAAVIGDPFRPSPTRGVYKTTDGGRSWARVLASSDSVGAVDVELQPGDPNTVFALLWRAERKPWTIISGAREGGLYRSTDAGATWTKVGGGLPTGLWGKGDLAVTPADPNRLYLLLEADPGRGLWRSDDRGATWALVSTQAGLLNRPFYYTGVKADPRRADVVYVNNESFFRSADGGRTFEVRPTPHGDNHDLWINPDDPRVMVQSNDGGAAVTLDGGATWSTQYNQPTAEIYQVAVDDQVPYRIYGAQQDQGQTHVIPSRPLSAAAPDDPLMQWAPTGGCETGPAVPSRRDPLVVFAACKGQFGRFDRRTGQEQAYWVGAQSLYGHDPKDLRYRFQRVSPLLVSRREPGTVYYASQYVHRTRDEGRTWERISPDLTANDPARQGISGAPITRDVTGEEYYATLYALAESPVQAGVLWAGANDGPIHVTRDGGRTWTNVTPRGLPPGGRVQTLEASPHRAGAAYVAVLRHLLGDPAPYLYRTDDFGRTWRRIVDGIPADHPARVIREDPVTPRLLYAGTERGVFVSTDDGEHWQPFRLNLPVVPVTDLAVHRGDLVISTQGRGHWILDDVTPLGTVTPATATSPATLFPPRETVRWRYEPFPAEPRFPQYPPPGATLTYALGRDAASVSLEILDAAGAVVRRWASGGGEVPTAGGRRRGRGPEVRLATGVGVHRVTWDLTLPGPRNGQGVPDARGGPMALPGRYRVRLTVDGRPADAGLTLVTDPRVRAAGVTTADLEAQLRLAVQVRDAVGDARVLSARLAARRSVPGADTAGIDALRGALDNAPGPYPQGMLITQLQYLYGMLTQADQRPGRDAYARFRELSAELHDLTRRAAVHLEGSTP